MTDRADRRGLGPSARALLVMLLMPLAASGATFKLVWLSPADDARLERSRLERAILGHPAGPAIDALRLALSDSRLELDAAGVRLDVQAVEVADAQSAKDAATRATRDGTVALLVDLPAAWTLAAAEATPLPVLNVGAADDELRQARCRRNLWHLGPSERMRADALAQLLVARRWSQVLLLTGPTEADRMRAATVQTSMRRYGLKLVAVRPFKLSADPRERDLANPLLLTRAAGAEHDVVWVVDADGEFAQSLPYRTAAPRPVVGDGGLVALGWSSRYDRYGAPQLSRRLAKSAARRMEAHDWAAWIGGRLLVAAVLKAPHGPAAAVHQALAEARVDGSKGVALGLRPWDGQLRQPLLLGDGQSVVATAPVDGVLHPRDVLDTLGADAAERLCRAREP